VSIKVLTNLRQLCPNLGFIVSDIKLPISATSDPV